MKYIAKYDRWVTIDGLVYRYDKFNDKLIICKQNALRNGYLRVSVNNMPNTELVHRLVWLAFRSEIQEGYEIDHTNTDKTDNRLDNLKCVTHKENMNNPLSRQHISIATKGQIKPLGQIRSEFGRKFKEHYNITRSDNLRLYLTEHQWYRTHNRKCRWEE